MSTPAKVVFQKRYIAYGIVYLALLTRLSMFTLDKAMNKSQELADYQIEKTRRFLGEEKAREMSDYIHGEARKVEEAPAADAEASLESEVTD